MIAAEALHISKGYAQALGNFIDRQVRSDLRRFGAAQGLPDSSASNLYSVNRHISQGDLRGTPDLRIGKNLISDVTLAPKNGMYEQLQRWNQIRPNDTVIIRPDAFGGSYVVPRSTISIPPKKPRV